MSSVGETIIRMADSMLDARCSIARSAWAGAVGARDDPFGSPSAQAPRDRVGKQLASGESGAVELLLQSRPAAMGLAKLGDQLINRDSMP